MALSLATIKTHKFATIGSGTAFSTQNIYEKTRRCLFEDENQRFNVQGLGGMRAQTVIQCSNETVRYTGTLLICENHLRQYFKLVIQEFDIKEVQDMIRSKYIDLVYAGAYKFTIPFPFELNSNIDTVTGVRRATLCLRPELIKTHDDRPASFYQSIVAFATNGVMYTPGFGNLNQLLSESSQPQNEFSQHYTTVINRWKNTYIMMKHTNKNNEINFTYMAGSELPYIYQTVLYYTEMSQHYVVPKNTFRADNLEASLRNCKLARTLQANMICDLDDAYFKMENWENPLKLYVLEDDTNYATPIILAGFQVFDEGSYTPHNYQHSSVDIKQFSAFCGM